MRFNTMAGENPPTDRMHSNPDSSDIRAYSTQTKIDGRDGVLIADPANPDAWIQSDTYGVRKA